MCEESVKPSCRRRLRFTGSLVEESEKLCDVSHTLAVEYQQLAPRLERDVNLAQLPEPQKLDTQIFQSHPLA